MSRHGNVRHLFPGANTPGGFYPHYDQIAPPDAARIFVLKGGPGVGKSTFMRRTADDLLSRGFDVELHHCSADNDSIDAIYIPAAGVALLDGTAPHVVDPRFPGAVDEIINLGAYWNEAALRAPDVREAIVRTTRACNFRFKRANDALKAAHACLEEWKAYVTDCLDTSAVDACAEALIADLVPNPTGVVGSARRLFASAITYDGPRHWLESLFGGAARRYVIRGEPGTGKSTIVGRITAAALARGYSLDLFHCPMYPERIDHLLIRNSDTAVITSTWPHEYPPGPQDRLIETSSFVDQAKLKQYGEEVEAAQAGFFAAIDREVSQLEMAKRIHDELERLYRPHMDFQAVENLRLATLDRIMSLAAEPRPATTLT